MDNLSWDDLRILLAIHERGSFFAAGEALGVATSTLSRRMDVVERRLGRRLLQRGAHGVTALPAAEPLLQAARLVQGRVAAAVRSMTEEDEDGPRTLRVAFGPGFGRYVVRAVERFQQHSPRTHFELVGSPVTADLPKREADVAIRTVRRGGDGVVLRRVAPLAYGLYATEAVRRRFSAPDDLRPGPWIGYCGELARDPVMRWLKKNGVSTFRVAVMTTQTMVEAATAGLGAAALPDALARLEPSLVRLPLRPEPPARSVYVALHRGLRDERKVHRFVELLAQDLQEALE